jgi:tetratricopeptide (TPR) repeat protein
MPRCWAKMLFGFVVLAVATVSHAQTGPQGSPAEPQPSPQPPVGSNSPIVQDNASTSPTLVDIGLGKVAPVSPSSGLAPVINVANSADIRAAQALLDSAHAHEKNKDFDKAVIDLEKAVALNPKYTAAFLDLAYLHNVKRNFDKAIAALDQAIALDSKLASAFASRGSAYAGKSNYPAAIADFDKAIALDAKYAYAYRNRASAYVDMREYDKALIDLGIALEIDPKSAFGHTIRGLAHSGKRDYERGIVDFDNALALDPRSIVAHSSRGNAYYNKMEYDRALADYNKAIELDPSSSYAYAGRGAVYAAKRRTDQAKIDFRQALALDPKNTFATDGLRLLGQPVPKPTPMPKSPAAAMKVMVVRSASPDCGEKCPEWISAQGDIDSDSPSQFRKVLKAIGTKKLPIFIESGGGSVSDGYEIGRMVRLKGLDVFVTKTEFSCPPNDLTCKDGKTKSGQVFGRPQPHLAKCASSCAFVLAGGVKRYVGKSSQVGVHQITSFQTQIKVWRTFKPDGTILSERKVSEKTVETKTADRTYAAARSFFVEMGINDSIMKLLRDAPANDMHWLSESDLTSTGMATNLINGQQFFEGRTSSSWSDADQQGLVEARRVAHAAALAAIAAKKSSEASAATAGASTAGPAARRKKCDPDEALIDGKCVEKPAVKSNPVTAPRTTSADPAGGVPGKGGNCGGYLFVGATCVDAAGRTCRNSGSNLTCTR